MCTFLPLDSKCENTIWQGIMILSEFVSASCVWTSPRTLLLILLLSGVHIASLSSLIYNFHCVLFFCHLFSFSSCVDLMDLLQSTEKVFKFSTMKLDRSTNHIGITSSTKSTPKMEDNGLLLFSCICEHLDTSFIGALSICPLTLDQLYLTHCPCLFINKALMLKKEERRFFPLQRQSTSVLYQTTRIYPNAVEGASVSSQEGETLYFSGAWGLMPLLIRWAFTVIIRMWFSFFLQSPSVLCLEYLLQGSEVK